MKNIYPYLLLLATITFALSPFFVEDFRGFDSSQLPNPQKNPPVQPAGYAFSIWGIIYLWLLGSAIYGALKKTKSESWHEYRHYLIVSLIIGSAWLPVALKSAEWATVLIWIMVITALLAHLKTPKQQRWILQVPVGLYAGWLTAASCVSLGIITAGYGLLNSESAAYLSLSIAIVIALFIQLRKPIAPEYGLTVIWALVAVIVANQDKIQGVQVFSGIGIVLMLALLIYQFKRFKTSKDNA